MNEKVIEDQVVHSLPPASPAVDHRRVFNMTNLDVNSASGVCVIFTASNSVVFSTPDSRARQCAQEHHKEYPDA
jgi:hypothetical protein